MLDLDSSGIEMNSDGPYYIEYHFTESFFTKAKMTKGEHTFHLTGLTDNGVTLKAEKTLKIEL